MRLNDKFQDNENCERRNLPNNICVSRKLCDGCALETRRMRWKQGENLAVADTGSHILVVSFFRPQDFRP